VSREDISFYANILSALGGPTVIFGIMAWLYKKYATNTGQIRESGPVSRTSKPPFAFYAVAAIAAVLLYWPPLYIANYASKVDGRPGEIGPMGPAGQPGQKGEPGTFPLEDLSKIKSLTQQISTLGEQIKSDSEKNRNSQLYLKADICLDDIKALALKISDQLDSQIRATAEQASNVYVQHRRIYYMSNESAMSNFQDKSRKCLQSDNVPQLSTASDLQLIAQTPNEPSEIQKDPIKYRKAYWASIYGKSYLKAVEDAVVARKAAYRQKIIDASN
jgi:hypothetical protein